MPRPAVIPRLAVCAALVFALAACTTGKPEAPPTTPTASPAGTVSRTATLPPPLFTTKAEALEAAKTAYAAYLKVVDDIGRDGGADIERMRAVTTGEARAIDMEALERYERKSARATGNTKFDSVRVERWNPQTSEVSIYVCEDITDVDVMNEVGESIVQTGRANRLPFIAEFKPAPERLLLARKYRWMGDDFCD